MTTWHEVCILLSDLVPLLLMISRALQVVILFARGNYIVTLEIRRVPIPPRRQDVSDVPEALKVVLAPLSAGDINKDLDNVQFGRKYLFSFGRRLLLRNVMSGASKAGADGRT